MHITDSLYLRRICMATVRAENRIMEYTIPLVHQWDSYLTQGVHCNLVLGLHLQNDQMDGGALHNQSARSTYASVNM